MRGHLCLGLLALACVLAGCAAASSQTDVLVPPAPVKWAVTKNVPRLKVVPKRFVLAGPTPRPGESHIDMWASIGEGNGDNMDDLDVSWRFSTPSGAYTRTVHVVVFGRAKLRSESLAQAIASGRARRFPLNRAPAHWFEFLGSRNIHGFAKRGAEVSVATADDVTHLDYDCGDSSCAQYWAASRLTLSATGLSFSYGEDWTKSGARLTDYPLSAARVVGGFGPEGSDAVVYTSVAGTRLFAWQGGRVASSPLDLRPNPLSTPQASANTLLVGDLNGDGRDELVGWSGFDDLTILAPAN